MYQHGHRHHYLRDVDEEAITYEHESEIVGADGSSGGCPAAYEENEADDEQTCERSYDIVDGKHQGIGPVGFDFPAEPD
jgi:hypothetical protein